MLVHIKSSWPAIIKSTKCSNEQPDNRFLLLNHNRHRSVYGFIMRHVHAVASQGHSTVHSWSNVLEGSRKMSQQRKEDTKLIKKKDFPHQARVFFTCISFYPCSKIFQWIVQKHCYVQQVRLQSEVDPHRLPFSTLQQRFTCICVSHVQALSHKTRFCFCFSKWKQ